MVVDGCQQSSELPAQRVDLLSVLLALSGWPEDGCILFRILTVGHCFVHVLVTSVSNAFRRPQEVLIAHRLDYSGSEGTDSYATPACTVESEPRVAIKLNRRHE
jgi:hypothetical protein